LNMGYDVSYGCVACCGFGNFEKREEDNYVIFEVIPCYCHPYNYFLSLIPTDKIIP